MIDNESKENVIIVETTPESPSVEVTTTSDWGWGEEQAVEPEENVEIVETPEQQVYHVDEEQPEPKEPETEETQPEYKPAPTHYNVNLQYPVYTKVDTKAGEAPALFIMPKRLTRTLKHIDNWSIHVDPKATIRNQGQGADALVDYHEKILSQGLNYHLPGDFEHSSSWFERGLDDENSDWVQEHIHGDEVIGIHQSSPGRIGAGGKVTEVRGEAAIDVVRNLLGLGLSSRVSLPHTGINIGLKPASESELYNLMLEISLNLRKAGHGSQGVLFQSTHFGTVETVWNFIKQHISRANVLGFKENPDILDDLIRITDLPTIYWAMATTLYPQGFKLELACSNDPSICQHVEVVNANLERMFWLNRKGLSVEQLDMLVKYRHMFTKEQVLEYQKLGNTQFNKSFKIDDTMEMRLRVPTIREFLESGERYVRDATEAIESVLTSESKVNEQFKHTQIVKQMSLATIREYSHWVERITVNKTTIIEDRFAIDDTMAILSNNADIVKTTFDVIQKFSDESSVAVIAIPNFSCPKCNYDYSTEENTKHPELVPVNPLKLFFELVDLRLLRLNKAASE